MQNTNFIGLLDKERKKETTGTNQRERNTQRGNQKLYLFKNNAVPVCDMVRKYMSNVPVLTEKNVQFPSDSVISRLYRVNRVFNSVFTHEM
jgi:hypothetical protein